MQGGRLSSNQDAEVKTSMFQSSMDLQLVASFVHKDIS